jgi:ubiquinone/menaquinone biosynthesis C-methylase UbiE
VNVSRVPGADHKRAAVEQWTADPCGAVGNPAEPGSRAYFDGLVETRLNYAPWMREELGYHETHGLDVLDVGCGQGIDLVLYARAGARVTGVDLTPRHVELARLHLERAGCAGEVVEGDAEDLPFADASFDRVSSNGVLHHTPAMFAALAEIFRVLRPGGEARIIVYNRRSFHYWLSQVLWHGILQGRLLRTRSMVGVLSETVEYTSVGARPLVQAYTPGELRRLLGDAGFSGVRMVIRHFRAEDLRPTRALARTRVGRLLLSEGVVERLGRVGGWYITAIGRKPA